MTRRWPIALLATVLVLDALIRHVDPGYAVLGLMDEPAHLATTGLLVGALATWCGGLPARVWAAALAASVLIDLDHLPDALGWDGLTHGTPRPYTHSVTTVVVLALLALVLRRRRSAPVVAGAALGVAAHLVRDAGTAPVALWWPLDDAGVSVPYLPYAVLLVAATTVLVARRGRPVVR